MLIALGVLAGLVAGLVLGFLSGRHVLPHARCGAITERQFTLHIDGVAVAGSAHNVTLRCTYRIDHSGPHRGVNATGGEIFWKQEIDLRKIDKQIEHLLPKEKK